MTNSTEAAPGDGLAALAGRISNGEREAEDELARLYSGRIRAIARVRTRNAELALELTQETLMAVITALRAGQLRDESRLTAFVYGILRNVLNNSFRSAGRQPALEPLDPARVVTLPDDPVEHAERREQVREALKRLGRDDRRILLFTLVDGLKPGEIAPRLGLTDEVVRARKSRALKRVIDFVRDRHNRQRPTTG